jgi:hypothetical protein
LDLGAWPAARQRCGQFARTAAEIDDQPGILSLDPAEQFSERPGSFGGEQLVLARIPHGGLNLS